MGVHDARGEGGQPRVAEVVAEQVLGRADADDAAEEAAERLAEGSERGEARGGAAEEWARGGVGSCSDGVYL